MNLRPGNQPAAPMQDLATYNGRGDRQSERDNLRVGD